MTRAGLMHRQLGAILIGVTGLLIGPGLAVAQSSPPAIRAPRTPPSSTPAVDSRTGTTLAAPPLSSTNGPPRAPAVTAQANPAAGNLPAATGAPNAASAAAAAGAPASTTRPGGARVTKGSGMLPNTHGQIWREYDITPYTSRVETTQKPEQSIIDWILRETGPEAWFGEPFGILNADKQTVRVYHTPEMHQVVSSIVDRFVSSEADSMVLSLRLATVGSPNWRTRAYPWLRPVEVRSAGVEAWLLSKENAALLIADLGRRADYREFNSPNVAIQNGQSHTISRLRPKSYVKAVRPRDTVVPGYDTEMGQIDEGVSLQIDPLFALDSRSVDVLVKCHIDQVEKLVPVQIDLPGFGGQWQRAQVQVPQVVTWRLHERFRWPTDQVLVLSCGVVAAPAAENRGAAAALVGAFGSNPGRADALLFIECTNRPAQPGGGQAENRATSPLGTGYRGRY